MKSMSDKDFDAFFKASLDQFKEEPTKDIWALIENDSIRSAPKRKKFPFVWVAACMAILAFGLILFRAEDEKIQLRKVDDVTAASVPEEQFIQIPMPTRQIVSFKPNNKAENERRFLELIASIEIEEKPVKKVKAEKKEPDFARAKHYAEIKEQQLINVQDNHFANQEGQYSEQGPLAKEQEVLTNTEKTDKEKVRSLGDLVNFVVGKIDKRENKIIHVSKTEESDMEITGINLGLIKYRKTY